MASVLKEEIVAIDKHGLLICLDCYEDNLDELELDYLFTECHKSQNEEIWFFCDECGIRI